MIDFLFLLQIFTSIGYAFIVYGIAMIFTNLILYKDKNHYLKRYILKLALMAIIFGVILLIPLLIYCLKDPLFISKLNPFLM